MLVAIGDKFVFTKHLLVKLDGDLTKMFLFMRNKIFLQVVAVMKLFRIIKDVAAVHIGTCVIV